MKYISASILLIAFLVQTGSRYLVMLDFELNQDYIAKNLCENRNKPCCHCNGKCYLKKQLNKADKETSNGTTSQKNQEDVLFFAEEKNTVNLPFTEAIITNHFPRNYSFAHQNLYVSVFHPPQINS